MRKYIIGVLLGLLSSVTTLRGGDTLPQSFPVVPRPAHMIMGEGSYQFSAKTVFVVENKEQGEIAQLLIDLFTQAAGFTPKLTIGAKKGNIRLQTDQSLKEEAYQLDITPKEIRIRASGNKGFFYALQTIRLLLPSAIENTELSKEIVWTVPALKITDEPRFGYRGLMLDVARCFLPKENVMRIIDCMAMLKLNTLHLHLTDDNGWRIEIKKYPKLTQVGGWRVDRKGYFPERRYPQPGEPASLGGFYTQEDIKEIVKYAVRRQVEVIPEIEMPAHSNAALASYPKLACPVVDTFIGVSPGGGHNSDVIFCAGNDTVYTFLQDVLDEVMALFPSRYIHIGGDEAQKKYWEKCPLCQARMQKEHFHDIEDLQGYFMGRISDYVRSKGREVMGWDELTNSKLPEGAIIYGWRGFGEAALKAAKQGHRFVMTPARITYLIRYQGPQWFEPVTYFGNITLKDVFDYEPVQPTWKPEYASLLMGVQGSLWTEFCNKPEDADYLMFPRAVAIAEIAWTQPDKKDWPLFLKAMDVYNEHIAKKGVEYARSMYNIQHKVRPENGKLKVNLECIRPDVQIHYTLDGSEPTASSPIYKKEWLVTNNQTIKCATFVQDRQMGKTLVLPIRWNKATTKPISGNTSNIVLLTNGVRGSEKYTDFEWCNWDRNDSISFTIDLQRKEPLATATLGCITNYGMGAHKPSLIRIAVSDDNKHFEIVAEHRYTPKEIFKEGIHQEDCVLDMKGSTARYVRVTLRGAGLCPPDHVRPGQESRIYLDEIQIE